MLFNKLKGTTSLDFTVGKKDVADPAAALEIVSTTKGVLAPKLTTAQMNAISSPPDGLTVYNTDVGCDFTYDDTITGWRGVLKRSAADFQTFTTKATVSESDWILIEDSADSNNKKKAQLSNIPGFDFGLYYDIVVDETLSTTTSSSWQQKLRLTATGIPAGRYRIAWSFLYGMSSSSRDFHAQVEENDTLQLWEQINRVTGTAAHLRYPSYGFSERNLTAGDYFWDLDFASEGNPGEARIASAKVEIWQVAGP